MSSKQGASESNELFRAVARQATLASRVTDQLENLIVERRLPVGDRLPAERELAQQFGVSRTVVREAVRSLVAKNLLEVIPGSGTHVRNPTSESISQSLSVYLQLGQPSLDYDKIHEVRRLLEMEIVALAAARRTDDDLAEMKNTLQEMANTQADRDSFAQNDVAFHAALARATQNELFALLLDSVVDIMTQVRRLGFDVPGAQKHALTYHALIFDQVKAGDAGKACHAMAEHLEISEGIFRKALKVRTDEKPARSRSA